MKLAFEDIWLATFVKTHQNLSTLFKDKRQSNAIASFQRAISVFLNWY